MEASYRIYISWCLLPDASVRHRSRSLGAWLDAVFRVYWPKPEIIRRLWTPGCLCTCFVERLGFPTCEIGWAEDLAGLVYRLKTGCDWALWFVGINVISFQFRILGWAYDSLFLLTRWWMCGPIWLDRNPGFAQETGLENLTWYKTKALLYLVESLDGFMICYFISDESAVYSDGCCWALKVESCFSIYDLCFPPNEGSSFRTDPVKSWVIRRCQRSGKAHLRGQGLCFVLSLA